MKKGEPARDQVRRKILYLASDYKEHTISEFLKECGCAKNTIYKYIRELVEDERLGAHLPLTRNGFKPRFTITAKGFQEWARMDLKEMLSSEKARRLSPEALQKVRALLEGFIREIPKEFEKDEEEGR